MTDSKQILAELSQTAGASASAFVTLAIPFHYQCL